MRKRILVIFAAVAAFVVFAGANNVSTAPTKADRTAGTKILELAGYHPDAAYFHDLSKFDNQIRTVLAVQDAVLDASPTEKGLPKGGPREPKNLLAAHRGICYDRSRSIEKILGSLGLQTRHIAVYSTAHHCPICALVVPGVDSHALTEVHTTKGWMLVDSNSRWIGLDPSGKVFGIADLVGRNPFKMAWSDKVREPISNTIFKGSFVYVIGLYSRHGEFYPPYLPFPDVNYAQLLQNFD